MTRHVTLATAVLFAATAQTVVAQTNEIVEWGGVDPNAYTIDQFARTIQIDIPGNHTFKFYAVDESAEPGTGIIDNITVHKDATGDFSLLIAYPVDPNDPNSPVDPNEAGALDWNEGDLRYAGGTSTVTGVKVAGLLSEPGKPIHIDRLDGSIDVAGSVARLTIYEWVSASPACIHVTAGWPILRAAKGGGAIRLGGTLRTRRCAAEAIEQRSAVASALHRRGGDATRRPF
jgi:hypothetical protein